MEMKEQILAILENIGIYIEKTDVDDIDLREYVLDSLQFITFVVELEKFYNIYFTDELLSMETFSSLNSLIIIIQALLKEKNEKENIIETLLNT